eukprot:COSAG02_NODE_442_length_22243_cov_20.572887_9_plen_111_part_00
MPGQSRRDRPYARCQWSLLAATLHRPRSTGTPRLPKRFALAWPALTTSATRSPKPGSLTRKPHAQHPEQHHLHLQPVPLRSIETFRRSLIDSVQDARRCVHWHGYSAAVQ